MYNQHMDDDMKTLELDNGKISIMVNLQFRQCAKIKCN